MTSQTQVTVWIVEDKPGDQRSAERAVREVFEKARLRLKHLYVSDGKLNEDGTLSNVRDQQQPDVSCDQPASADFVVLDLRFYGELRGPETVFSIPGVSHERRQVGPFVVIWSNFAGDQPWEDDRLAQAKWKSEQELVNTLTPLVDRFRAEGVYHPAKEQV